MLALSKEIMALYEETPTIEKVQQLLCQYCITPIGQQGKQNFDLQLESFLGAKQTEGLSARTIGNYRLYLDKFGESVGKAPADISTNDIRRYIGILSSRGLKKTSIQTVINTLRSYFSWLTVEEMIPKNPMLRIHSFRIDKKQARHPLVPEELERLRDACIDYREKAIIEFLYSTGCRLSEAVSIDLESVNFDRRTVNVIGKGDKERTLYFTVRARLMIQEYMLGRKDGTALFTSCRAPYDRLGTRAIQMIIGKVGERAGLSRHVHPHILRHTFATNALNAGMDITVIQQLLGHTSVATTQIYAEINQENMRREYDKFVA